jgi:hypothetical protein
MTKSPRTRPTVSMSDHERGFVAQSTNSSAIAGKVRVSCTQLENDHAAKHACRATFFGGATRPIKGLTYVTNTYSPGTTNSSSSAPVSLELVQHPQDQHPRVIREPLSWLGPSRLAVTDLTIPTLHLASGPYTVSLTPRGPRLPLQDGGIRPCSTAYRAPAYFGGATGRLTQLKADARLFRWLIGSLRTHHADSC